MFFLVKLRTGITKLDFRAIIIKYLKSKKCYFKIILHIIHLTKLLSYLNMQMLLKLLIHAQVEFYVDLWDNLWNSIIIIFKIHNFYES